MKKQKKAGSPMHLRAQENTDMIVKAIMLRVRKDGHKLKLISGLEKLAKHEIIYVGIKGRETRIVVGRHIGISRCMPGDKYDREQGIVMALSNLIEMSEIMNKVRTDPNYAFNLMYF